MSCLICVAVVLSLFMSFHVFRISAHLIPLQPKIHQFICTDSQCGRLQNSEENRVSLARCQSSWFVWTNGNDNTMQAPRTIHTTLLDNYYSVHSTFSCQSTFFSCPMLIYLCALCRFLLLRHIFEWLRSLRRCRSCSHSVFFLSIVFLTFQFSIFASLCQCHLLPLAKFAHSIIGNYKNVFHANDILCIVVRP